MNPQPTPALALVVSALQDCCEAWSSGAMPRADFYEHHARALLQKLDALPSPVTVGTESAWWALVMGAAASLQDAAACLSDPDAKRAAELAAEHYRKAAKNLTEQPR